MAAKGSEEGALGAPKGAARGAGADWNADGAEKADEVPLALVPVGPAKEPKAPDWEVAGCEKAEMPLTGVLACPKPEGAVALPKALAAALADCEKAE